MKEKTAKKSTPPQWAFIAAAGMGQRMRPLTNSCPKPLIEIGGHSLLDHIVDHLLAEGITDIVLNAHYMPEKIEEWAEARAARTPNIQLTMFHEEDLLDTGGGVLNAVRADDRAAPFYMINGDAFWINESSDNRTLAALNKVWSEGQDKLLLLLEPTAQMALTAPVGDYQFDERGAPVRTPDHNGDHMFTGVRICDPALFHDMNAQTAFSFLDVMDSAQNLGVLGGLSHQGRWHHLSTPEDVTRVNDALADLQKDAAQNSKGGNTPS